jgi:ABC-type uncharacterized transport system permease subunit
VAAVLAVAIAGLLYLLLYRTRIGKAIRAVASNREAAERRARGGIKRGLITLQKRPLKRRHCGTGRVHHDNS